MNLETIIDNVLTFEPFVERVIIIFETRYIFGFKVTKFKHCVARI